MNLMFRSLQLILVCILLFCPNASSSATKSAQHTEGDQAPIVNVSPGGKSTINYGATDRHLPNIVPEIKCKFEYPFIKEKDVVRKKFENPQLVITNMGPIKAVSFSVDHTSYLYDIKSAKLEYLANLFNETNNHFIFVKEIQPSEDIKKDLYGFTSKGKIGIYTFILKYYRESDMKLFSRREIFFIENNEIFSEKDYKKSSKYSQIIQAMDSYRLDANTQKVCLLGIDSHTWLVKESPKTGVYIDKNGKGFTIAPASVEPLTIIRQKELDKDRPLLFVRPWIQKESGNYIDPEIVDNDTVNIKLVMQIENIGDKKAINISANGEDSLKKLLSPGESFTIRQEIELTRPTGDKHSPQDLISREYVLTFGTTISYSNELGNKQYQTEFLYNIGKYSIQLVNYKVK